MYDPNRFSRHLLLPEVGPAGQARLSAASVLVVGAGGLGSPVALYLAAAGVGRIGLIDDDRVDLSNLQRQVLFDTSQVGQPKVHEAARRLRAMNPGLTVEPYAEALGPHNALERIGAYDLVVDGSDNFPTRYLVNDAAVLTHRPCVYGAVHRFEGQASVFNLQGGPDYRDLFPEPPEPDSVPTCAEGGVLGVLPGLIGLIQATEALKVLLEIGEPLRGRLLLVDGLGMRFRELAFRRDPLRAPVTELVDYQAFCRVSTSSPPSVKLRPEAFEARRAAGWDPYLLDVRRPPEAEIVQVRGTAALQPHDALRPEELPRDRDIVVYCKSGRRSALAWAALREAGLERLFDLEGGVLAWAERFAPEAPRY